ncbi:MAG: sulfatase-like hydrolase/transferase, partial [Bacteroidales bacterium]
MKRLSSYSKIDRWFMIAMLPLILLISFSCTRESRKKGETKPNILIFIADDTGFKDVGYHGSEIETPNIDRLATEGLILDQHYVYQLCSPTRAALLTGRPPSRFGLTSPLQPFTDFRFPEGTQMLPSVLKGAGYETSLVGKWHLGMVPDQSPNTFGFDHSYGYTGPWIDSYSHLVGNRWGDGSGIRQWQRNGELIQEHGHVTDLITKEAVRFISEKRDKTKPFFLYVAYSAPHVPCQEPKEFTDLYEGVIENNSRLFFAAAMTHLDESMGEIVRTLEEEGIEEQTLVIFTSDNGGQRGGNYGASGSGWLIPPDEY